jgi:hypothetical protein
MVSKKEYCVLEYSDLEPVELTSKENGIVASGVALPAASCEV